jgi:hypothetical protein
MIKHNRSFLQLVTAIWCFGKALPLFNVLADFTNRFVWYRFRWVRAWARVHLGGPRQCLRVDILPDVRHFAISNGNGEDPMVLPRPIRGFDFPPSEADDQNPVALRYEFGGSGLKFPPFRKPSEANPPIPRARGACRPAASPRPE